jgi:hypothetical protein
MFIIEFLADTFYESPRSFFKVPGNIILRMFIHDVDITKGSLAAYTLGFLFWLSVYILIGYLFF